MTDASVTFRLTQFEYDTLMLALGLASSIALRDRDQCLFTNILGLAETMRQQWINAPVKKDIVRG